MKYDIGTMCGIFFVDPLTLRPVMSSRWRMTATLKWAKEDAAAVTVDILQTSDHVPHDRRDYASWRFSRDHFFDATIKGNGAGEGDYRLAPFFDAYSLTNWLYLTLRDDVDQEERTLAIDRRTASSFVMGTTMRVALGAEDYSAAVDRFIATLPHR